MPQDEQALAPSAEKSPDETPSASSTEKTASSSDKEPTMLDVARKAAQASLAREDAEIETETPAESPVPEKDKTEAEEEGVDPEQTDTEDPEKTEEKKDEPEESEDLEEEVEEPEEEESAELPFDKHPVWIKRTKEFNALKAEAETLRKTQRSPADEEAIKHWGYHKKTIQDYGVPQAEVDYMISILCAYRSNPTQAREMMRPVWEKMSDLDENSLPPDLQKAVENEEITEDMAKRLWKSEVQNKAGRVTGEFAVRTQAQRAEAARQEAIGSWEAQKRGSDPDYKPKAADADDGLWEFVADRYMRLFAFKPAENAAQEVALLDQAYREVKKSYAPRVRPSANGHRKNLTSKRSLSNSSQRGEPKTIDDAVKQTLQKHGIAWDGRKVASS